MSFWITRIDTWWLSDPSGLVCLLATEWMSFTYLYQKINRYMIRKCHLPNLPLHKLSSTCTKTLFLISKNRQGIEKQNISRWEETDQNDVILLTLHSIIWKINSLEMHITFVLTEHARNAISLQQILLSACIHVHTTGRWNQSWEIEVVKVERISVSASPKYYKDSKQKWSNVSTLPSTQPPHQLRCWTHLRIRTWCSRSPHLISI